MTKAGPGRPKGTVPTNKNSASYRYGPRIAVRKEFHAAVKAAAATQGVSISFWVEQAIRKAAPKEVAEVLGLMNESEENLSYMEKK